MIKASGYSVFPAEVEALIYEHPAVEEVAVIGVPDPYRGENIKAFVILRPGFKGRITETDLVSWAKGKWPPTSIRGSWSLWRRCPRRAPGRYSRGSSGRRIVRQSSSDAW